MIADCPLSDKRKEIVMSDKMRCNNCEEDRVDEDIRGGNCFKCGEPLGAMPEEETMRDVFTAEQINEMSAERADIKRVFPNDSEALKWMHRLWRYSVGHIKGKENIAPWDTGMDWVCEEHPHLPFPHGDCIGPGMPPIGMNTQPKEQSEPNEFRKEPTESEE